MEGKAGFYEGSVAECIVEAVGRYGGCLSLDDLRNHDTTYEDPIHTDYNGTRLWEIPPNGQGIVALMALNLLEGEDLKGICAVLVVLLYLNEFLLHLELIVLNLLGRLECWFYST